jgi:pimeloyl-ACP methyl ester carboxylesterase
LSNFLKAVESQAVAAQLQVKFTMVALSPRGYWKSSGRASQKGIEKDAQALLQWISASLSADNENMEFILWGQSLGAGVASTAAARYLTSPKEDTTASPPVIGLLLETPFTSIKSMLLALYPQKWLPYKYLHPFLWNHWDSPAALTRIGESFARQGCIGDAPKVLLMVAEKDEVVPAEEVVKLKEACEKAGLTWKRRDAAGALHVDALAKRGGRDQAAKWVVEVVRGNDGTAE